MAKFNQIISKFQLQFCCGWCACVCRDCLVATTTFTFKINSNVKTNNFGRESASSRALRRAWKEKKCSIRSWTNFVSVVAMRHIQMDRAKIFNMFFRWTFRVHASPHRRHSSEHWNCKTIIRIGNEVNRVILSWLWAGRVIFLFIIFHLGELKLYDVWRRATNILNTCVQLNIYYSMERNESIHAIDSCWMIQFWVSSRCHSHARDPVAQHNILKDSQ